MNVAVFAASSSKVDLEYFRAASHLGELFADAGFTAIFGGGGIGLMGSLADAMLSINGKIIGVIPRFMVDEGWNHLGISEMIITNTMSERKNKIFELADAVVALPGGIGTLEELTEAITLKQLGLWDGQIILLNTKGYYDNLSGFFETMVNENFMRREHKAIWKMADSPDETMSLLTTSSTKDEEWRKIAKI
jgi:uncharacterized protein (TIGR00730 family)